MTSEDLGACKRRLNTFPEEHGEFPPELKAHVIRWLETWQPQIAKSPFIFGDRDAHTIDLEWHTDEQGLVLTLREGSDEGQWSPWWKLRPDDPPDETVALADVPARLRAWFEETM